MSEGSPRIPSGRSTRNLSARIDNQFASIVLSSLDARPIARASRLPVTTWYVVTVERRAR